MNYLPTTRKNTAGSSGNADASRPAASDSASATIAMDMENKFDNVAGEGCCETTNNFLKRSSVRSLWSFASVGSTCSFLSVGAFFGIASVLSTSSVASIASVNSVVSVGSVNSVLCLGCSNEFLKNCWA